MTIDEAIKEMSGWKLDCRLAFSERHENAIRLGIEALERLNELRNHEPQSLSTTWGQIFSTLPSETEPGR